jgi:hypothetical protein
MVRPGPAAQAQVQAGATPGRVVARHRDALATASRVAEGHVRLEDLANVLDWKNSGGYCILLDKWVAAEGRWM